MVSRRFIVLVAAVVSAACASEDTSGSSLARNVHGADAGDGTSGDGGASNDGGPSSGSDAGSGPSFSGEATYYDANGTGACGFPASTDFMVAAINDEQYSKENCGKCVEVTGPRGTAIVRIVDKCPGCDSGDLDLSQTAFGKVARLSDGRVKITWRFVACP